MLGSSVVYGLGVTFAQTIPGAIERELEAGGHPAEVLNFGTHAFSIVNLSALLQAYVHQFHPQVVVVVVDLQVGLPRWPSVHPASAGREAGIGELNWWETLLERGSPKSALLAAFQDPRPARRWIRRTTGLPLQPRGRATPGPEPDAVRPAPVSSRGPWPEPQRARKRPQLRSKA